MKIAVVHSFYSSASPSGENAVVRDQVQALAEAGHDVRLVARHTDEESTRPFYKLTSAVNAANGPGPSPDATLSEFQPDIVHVHNLFPNWGTQWLKKWQGRLVATVHNFRPLCSAATLWRDGDDCTECLDAGSHSALKHRCYRDSVIATAPLAFASRGRGRHQPVLRFARRLITLNDHARATYDGLARGHVLTIPNFVQPRSAPADSREGWLYVGRLTPEKGVLELIESFPAEHHLTIAGEGPLAARVRDRAENSANVTFVGRLSPEEVAVEMASSSGVIIPSLWAEGIPTVALEALSASAPLIISNKCLSAEQLTSGGAGRVYDPYEGRSLAVAVRAIAASSAEYQRGAESRYRLDYSPDIWLERIVRLYEEVAALGQDR
ncbi:glycosyltransferase family 4 protein [Nigerium massiliense]|uniref:glycosyltransferase family 4 protein n=1 Tax=Nigerium massiliense TaxID=1522317 RepID=UPI000693E6DF|nr:glycosyltransferase family 4 protein [Nigerium massiliense]